MAKNNDGSIKDDGTLSGYYASRREERLKREAERTKDDNAGKGNQR